MGRYTSSMFGKFAATSLVIIITYLLEIRCVNEFCKFVPLTALTQC